MISVATVAILREHVFVPPHVATDYSLTFSTHVQRGLFMSALISAVYLPLYYSSVHFISSQASSVYRECSNDVDVTIAEVGLEFHVHYVCGCPGQAGGSESRKLLS